MEPVDYIMVNTFGKNEFNRVKQNLFDRYSDGEFCSFTTGAVAGRPDWRYVRAMWCGGCFGGLKTRL